MQLLLIHADYLEFEVKEKALKSAKKPKRKKARIDECLVVFTAVEKSDEADKKEVAKNAVQEITQVAKEVGAKRVVLYPYVHLTRQPSSPAAAEEILDDIATELKFDVERVPFGYYKSFTVKCKGHPLAELSRTITAEKKEKKVVEEKKEKVIEKFVVILPNGQMKDWKAINKKKFPKVVDIIEDELGKKKEGGGEPAHIELASKLQLGGREPVSDAGNLRFLPNGAFIKQLMRDLTWNKLVVEHGGYPITTPLIIRKEDPGVVWLTSSFPERQYKVLPGKEDKNVEMFLKTAGDYGSFSIHRDAVVSYKNLPMGLYEDEQYDHRYEQRGELRGFYRIRMFEMHNIHTVVKDDKQALEIFKKCFDRICEILGSMGIRPDGIIFFCVKDYFNKGYKDYLKKLAKRYKTPVVVEILKKVNVYMHAWIDYLVCDSLGRPMEIGTAQLDPLSPKNWNIKYTDAKGKQQTPLMVHSGYGVERSLAAMLEYLAREKNPTFPLWLSPTQVRLCPITSKDLKTAEKIADELEQARVRVDIDDTNETTGKKVRNAELEWVPMIVVVGPKEKKGPLPVRFRKTSKVKKMSIKQIIDYVQKEIKDKPFRPLPLPRLLSKRPTFVG